MACPSLYSALCREDAQHAAYRVAPRECCKSKGAGVTSSLLHRTFKQRGAQHVVLEVPELLCGLSPGR